MQAASVQDPVGAAPVLAEAKANAPQLQLLWADARYQGSCGAPILDARFITQGPHRGRSVWQLARRRFEQQRVAAQQPFGPPPAGTYGPSNACVNQLKNQPATDNNASCGQCGGRQCSYAADPTARALAAQQRVLLMAQQSALDMPATLATCPAHDY